MKKTLFSIMLLMPVLAWAQPTYDITADVNYPDRKLQDLTMLQGATPVLRVYVEQNGAKYTSITRDRMTFYYGASGNASAYVSVTNSSVSGALGSFDINISAANLNTNGSFWYTVLLTDTNGGIYYSGDGALEIRKTTVTGSPGALSLTTPLSWDGFVYSSPDSAPALAGSGVTATTNASGQVTFSVVSASSITVTAGAVQDDGSTPMQGNFNLGEYSLTNGLSVEAVTGRFAVVEIEDVRGTGEIKVGNGVTSSGLNSQAFGENTTASGAQSHAEGKNTTASWAQSHAEGESTIASSLASHAEGFYSVASTGIAVHAEGMQTLATGDGAHAEGYATEALGSFAHAEGYATRASGNYSHAEGYFTIASGSESHAAGKYMIVSNDNAFGWSDSRIFRSIVANSWSTWASGGYRFYGGAYAAFDSQVRAPSLLLMSNTSTGIVTIIKVAGTNYFAATLPGSTKTNLFPLAF